VQKYKDSDARNKKKETNEDKQKIGLETQKAYWKKFRFLKS